MNIRAPFQLLFCLAVFVCQPAMAQQQFTSGPQQVTLIELYTSEGCSSCPPADRWLSSLQSDTGLWQAFIPLGLHVDYWDDLGWPDVFAEAQFSARQRQHRSIGGINNVYTPGFVVNGREWREPFRAVSFSPPRSDARPGSLTLTVANGEVLLEFSAASGALNYHLALLGNGLHTRVARGENAGKTLRHDFVVLNLQQQTGTGSVRLPLPQLPANGAKSYALAAWVTDKDNLRPIQAVGGVLDVAQSSR